MAEPSPWDRVVEMARISLENPVAMAVLRLHREEYGSCAECGPDSNKGWPCPTWLAIEQVAARPKGFVLNPEAMTRYAFVVRWADGREPELATRHGQLVASTDKTVLCPPYEAVVFSGDPAWAVPVADEPVLERPPADDSSASDGTEQDNPKESP